jgi:hypothetical protein
MIWAKAMEAAKPLEMQRRRTPRGKGSGMLARPCGELGRPSSVEAGARARGRARSISESEVGGYGEGVGRGHSTDDRCESRRQRREGPRLSGCVRRG